MTGGQVPLLPLPPPSRRRFLRKTMGVTVREAAAELKVSARTYSRWEKGTTGLLSDHHRAYHELLAKWEAALSEFL